MKGDDGSVRDAAHTQQRRPKREVVEKEIAYQHSSEGLDLVTLKKTYHHCTGNGNESIEKSIMYLCTGAGTPTSIALFGRYCI